MTTLAMPMTTTKASPATPIFQFSLARTNVNWSSRPLRPGSLNEGRSVSFVE